MIISDSSPLAAWQAASFHLIKNGREDYNLLVTFPCASAIDESPLEEFNPRRILGTDFDMARNVANTIFPKKTFLNSKSRDDFYARYLRAHSRASQKRWGTYFERLISFGDSEVNQLENVIVALSTWKLTYRAAMNVHLSSADIDPLKPLGSPCLQYIQFNCPTDDQIDLLAVYRNHDYCNKVLGNYFGLSRLLNFVCTETGRTAGQVSCLSAHAYYDISTKNMKILTGAN